MLDVMQFCFSIMENKKIDNFPFVPVFFTEEEAELVDWDAVFSDGLFDALQTNKNFNKDFGGNFVDKNMKICGKISAQKTKKRFEKG